MCCTRLAANTGRKKVAKNRHLGTIAQLCRAISSQVRHVSTIGKSSLSSNMSSMSPQYGELRPTSGWDRFGSLGHPTKFQRMGSVTARHVDVVVGVSQTLRRWIEGATYVRQGDHHVGHWPTFLVVSFFTRGPWTCYWINDWLYRLRFTALQHFMFLKPRLHDTTGGQTALTTGCIV